MDKQPEQNYLAWHLNQALPNFIDGRTKQVTTAWAYFNIAGLAKNLLAPYRRLTAKPKTTLTERISFDLISRIVGATVRTLLIITAIFSIMALIIFEIFASLTYLSIPLFSYPRFLAFKKNNFFPEDLQDPQKFAQKLTGCDLFRLLRLFFEEDFRALFNQLPVPSSLLIKPGQTPQEITLLLFLKLPNFKSYLDQKNIKVEQFKLLLGYLQEHLNNPPKKFFAPIGQILTFGYTNTLDSFSSELTQQSLPAHYPRRQIITQIENALTRPANNNVILVGETGVGRHSILESLASAIQKGQISSLTGKRVILLDTIAVTGSAKNNLELKSRFEAILAEAKHAGNIILAIDNIDRIVTPLGERIDLSEVLTTLLTDNSLPIIGITTVDDFNEFVRPNTNLLKLFTKIDVEETTYEETTTILIGKSLNFYQKEKINTTLAAIIEIIDKTSKLLADRRQPDKSIGLLQDAIAEAKRRKIYQVTVTLVDEILSTATKTPVGIISQKESEKLTKLESVLHKRIVGQDEAISEIAKALRRARAEIETGARPIGSFLFLGPTGVGKTETAKALAEIYFGAETRMIRFDMSEFNSQESTERLIGNAQNKMPGQLSSLVRQYPFSLLLVDEFEKAAPNVHNLFLQILEEGFLTDAFGKKVSFDNIIIIATSNAAAEFIREQISASHTSSTSRILLDSQGESFSKKVTNYVLEKGLFSPELINRFDAVVVYQPLTKIQTVQVTTLMLQKLAKQLKESKNINLEITPELAQVIAEKGFDPTFGARPIRRLIADKIEDGIAKMIIEGSVHNGDKIAASALLRFVC